VKLNNNQRFSNYGNRNFSFIHVLFVNYMYNIFMGNLTHANLDITLGARVLCAIAHLTRNSATNQLFSAQDIKEAAELLFPGSMLKPGLATHISSHCVVNTNSNSATEQRFLWRVSRDKYRLVRKSDISFQSAFRVTWPNLKGCSNRDRELAEWAISTFQQASSGEKHSVLDLFGSARHLFVGESAAEYIARAEDSWK
jgi:hypothetical protein